MQQDVKNTVNAMQPPRSVEEVKAELESTEKGGVRQSIRNCLTVFQRDPVLAGAIAYNSLTDRKDMLTGKTCFLIVGRAIYRLYLMNMLI